MARQVLPILGTVVGGMIGGPVGAQIGGVLGGIAGNALDPQVIKGPKLGEAGIQTSAEGVYRPIVYGTGAVKGNVIERGNRRITIKEEQQGKGGPITETERVSWTFAIRIAEGPIAGITRIWQDEKLVYDITPGSTIPNESAAFIAKCRIYLGDETQLPDPALEAYKGVGDVNAYRGTAYAVFPNFDLTDYGERIPDFRWEVVRGVAVTRSGWVMTAAQQSGQVREGHSIWRSADLATWDGPFERSPSPIDYPTYGPIRVSDGLLIAGNDNIIEKSVDMSFDTGFAITKPTITGATQIGRIRPFGDIVVAMNTVSAGNKYWTSSDRGATWTERTAPNSPSNVGLLDIARLDLGDGIFRWVAVLSDGPSTRFIFSDSQGEPISWSDADVVGANIASTVGSITCNGSVAAYLGTNGRIATTFTGATWEHTATLPEVRNGGRDAAQFGDTLVIATEGASNGICRSKNNGASWDLIEDPLPAFQVQRLSYGDGALVVSLPSVFIEGGVDRAACVSYDDGDTWSWLTLPDTIADVVRVAYYQASLEGGWIALADIVTDLHLRAGHVSDEFNVSEMTELVDGLVLAGDYTCGDAIRTLLPVYMYDAGEHDPGTGYAVNYIKRGKPVVATLTFDDLVEAPESQKREDALERPKKLHLHFQNPLIGYAPAKATIFRNSPDVNVVGEVSVQVPVTFSDVDEAWQRAERMMKVAWAEVGGTQKLSLSFPWLKLVPTDVIGLSLRNQIRRLRIQKGSFAEGVNALELMADRQSAYDSRLTGIPLPPPTPPLPSIVGPTISAMLDIPALIDTNDRPLYYVAATGQTEAWSGAQIDRSLDGGANYALATTFKQGTVMGVLLDDIADASEHYTDTTNTVPVELYLDREIDSLTQQQFLSEGGAFAVEKPGGGWEVMQYRDAETDSDGIVTLSTLLRGRLNSGTTAHDAGAMVVFLDSVKSVDAVTAWLNQDLTHRATSYGTSPEDATPYTDTYTMQSQREWPVAHLFGAINGDNLELSCVPRHRFGTEDHPVRSANWTGYRWTATDGTNTATVDTLADTATFDVTGWDTPITATVAQLNRFTGAGPTVSEDFA